jgi:hypothetical protein
MNITFDETQAALLLELLGLEPDATAEDILETIEQLTLAEPTGPAVTSASSPADPGAAAAAGMVTVDAGTLAALKADADAGRAVTAAALRRDRETIVLDAIKAGKIPPARRKHWEELIEKDPESARMLASMPENLIPVREIGHSLDLSATTGDDAPVWFH